VLAPAADEVSAAITALMNSSAQEYQALSAQAATFHSQFVSLMNAGAGAYSLTEAANSAFGRRFPAPLGQEIVRAETALESDIRRVETATGLNPRAASYASTEAATSPPLPHPLGGSAPHFGHVRTLAPLRQEIVIAEKAIESDLILGNAYPGGGPIFGNGAADTDGLLDEDQQALRKLQEVWNLSPEDYKTLQEKWNDAEQELKASLGDLGEPPVTGEAANAAGLPVVFLGGTEAGLARSVRIAEHTVTTDLAARLRRHRNPSEKRPNVINMP
jgi:hypothetical protein